MNAYSQGHTSVMSSEVANVFSSRKLKVFYEGTVGAGGHAKMLLEQHPEIERYIACDKDPQALQLAESILKPWHKKVEFVHGSFADLDRHLEEKGINKADGFFLIWGCRLCN